MFTPKRILLFFGFLVFLISFYQFSLWVKHGHFQKTDFDITVRLQDHIPQKWEKIFYLLSSIGSAAFTVLIWAGVLIYSLIRKYWLAALSLFLFWGSILAEIFGKVLVDHPGPAFMFFKSKTEFQFSQFYTQTQHSYPSGHLIRTTFLAIFIYFLITNRSSFFIKLLGFLGLIGFIILMGISRVYLGEHWTSDVVGGTLLGVSLGCLSALTLPNKTKMNLD